MSEKTIADIRREYSREELAEDRVSNDPFDQFNVWLKEALAAELPEPTAMTLSTADATARPSSRVVLLKGYDNNGFIFFTNYESQKGRELGSNPFASLNFFWPELERQVNISGSVERVSESDSEEYFRSRPFESRIGAWASKQSSTLSSRLELEERVAALTAQYSDGDVPLPPFWGGFRVMPSRFEFWQGRPSRLHDRICYLLDEGKWSIVRLSP